MISLKCPSFCFCLQKHIGERERRDKTKAKKQHSKKITETFSKNRSSFVTVHELCEVPQGSLRATRPNSHLSMFTHNDVLKICL